MVKPPLAAFCAWGLIALPFPCVRAQSVEESAQKEVVRRQQDVTRALRAIALGDDAMKDKDFNVAMVDYQSACNLLHEAPATHDLRAKAVDGLTQAGVKLAGQRITAGRYSDAEIVVGTVLETQYNPDCKPAILLFAHLEAPDYYIKNKDLPSEDESAAVKQLLADARGFYDTGHFQLADKRCAQVLILDPANAAALKGRQEADTAWWKYESESYNRVVALGDKAFDDQRYDLAAAEYQLAFDFLREAPPTHDELRARALYGFSQASMALAEQRFAEGRVEDAMAAVRAVLDPKYNPTYKPARQLLALMEPPDTGYPGAMPVPKFTGSTADRVQRLFTEAKGFYETGRFDLAYKRYDQILDIDPYNTAARKGQEQVLAAKSRYEEGEIGRTGGLRNIAPPENLQGLESIKNKLDRIIIPNIEFKDATLPEALDFLRKKSLELDTMETQPGRKGVSIVMQFDYPTEIGGPPRVPILPEIATARGYTPVTPYYYANAAKITLSLRNVPLGEALRYIATLEGFEIKIAPDAVILINPPKPADSPPAK